MSDKPKGFWRDENGAVMIEFTATIVVFMVILFGIVEFGNAFFQWNAATNHCEFGKQRAHMIFPHRAAKLANRAKVAEL